VTLRNLEKNASVIVNAALGVERPLLLNVVLSLARVEIASAARQMNAKLLENAFVLAHAVVKKKLKLQDAVDAHVLQRLNAALLHVNVQIVNAVEPTNARLPESAFVRVNAVEDNLEVNNVAPQVAHVLIASVAILTNAR
jgi:hypothetical protein